VTLDAPSLPVRRMTRLDLTFAPRPWPFEAERSSEIAAHFASLRESKPSLWNGRVLLLHDHDIEGDVFRGRYLEADFASFIACRDWGFPDKSIRNCFALGALRGADGGFLLGVMGAHTANAGLIYFPGGTPDPDDLVDGRVDLERSVRREVEEETGLPAASLDIAGDWQAVFAGPRIAMMKIMQSRASAASLRESILANLARQKEPELSDIMIVRSPGDLHPRMPDFVTSFLKFVWR
jgi:8-oxo-dGTP pyrophosphatase MutT (NUDIX family)